MHEQGVTRRIIELIERESETLGITPRKVFLEIGLLTTYRKDPILFYFENMRPKSMSHTELAIKEIEGVVSCRTCGESHNINEEIMMFCPVCDSTDVELISGREFRIVRLEE